MGSMPLLACVPAPGGLPALLDSHTTLLPWGHLTYPHLWSCQGSPKKTALLWELILKHYHSPCLLLSATSTVHTHYRMAMFNKDMSSLEFLQRKFPFDLLTVAHILMSAFINSFNNWSSDFKVPRCVCTMTSPSASWHQHWKFSGFCISRQVQEPCLPTECPNLLYSLVVHWEPWSKRSRLCRIWFTSRASHACWLSLV